MALALAMVACNSPSRAVRPLILSQPEAKYLAMKSAPVIVIAKVLDFKLVSGAREVEQPGDAFNRPRVVPCFRTQRTLAQF